jgi:hypothetical protein
MVRHQPGMPNVGRRSVLVASLLTVAACGKRTEAAPLEAGDDCQIAREAERRGDYATARGAYATCLGRVQGFVDSHVAYQRILELEDGIAAARTIYAELSMRNPGVVTAWAAARILPRPERAAALERLVVSHPDFAPLHYELSLEHSERVLGTQSLSAKSREKLYLQGFLDRAKGEAFTRNFADYAFAESWVRDAEARLAKLGDVSAFASEPPLKMTATPSSAGWMVHFQPAEPVKSMEYRVDGGDWRALEMYFSTPMKAAAIQIEVRYVDPSGALQGPYDFVLEPRKALLEFGKGVLEKMPTVWAAIGEDHNAGYLYFTTIMVYRCAISRVEYGLGTMTPDTEFELPVCDPADPMAIPSDAPLYVAIDPTLPFVSVRLTFADGEVSEIARIDRKTPAKWK